MLKVRVSYQCGKKFTKLALQTVSISTSGSGTEAGERETLDFQGIPVVMQ
jgi:hypothetical protein